MLYPLTDDQVRRLAKEYMKIPRVRETMDLLGITEEEYIDGLRGLFPYPVATTTGTTEVPS